MMECMHYYQSPLGNILMASNGNALPGLWFEGQKYFCENLCNTYEFKKLPVFEQTDHWLDLYFDGKEPDFIPPLYLNATPFRRAVWDILLTIPYGCTMTYGEIAKQLARQKGTGKMSAQAVGGAVGHNPISLIIPCHRVIGANGNLTGYAGGIDKKIQLLTIEKVDMSSLYIPKKGTAL